MPGAGSTAPATGTVRPYVFRYGFRSVGRPTYPASRSACPSRTTWGRAAPRSTTAPKFAGRPLIRTRYERSGPGQAPSLDVGYRYELMREGAPFVVPLTRPVFRSTVPDAACGLATANQNGIRRTSVPRVRTT